jgi:hypothetical protein
LHYSIMPNLILHVGPPKTGSTAIQRMLAEQRDALATRGVHYYCEEWSWEWALVMPYRIHDKETLPLVLRRRFSSVAEALEWSATQWSSFEAWLDARRPGTVVLSSEHFSGIGDKAGLIARLRRHFDRIDVIGYARDPVASYTSALEELIRTGWSFWALPMPHGQGTDFIRTLRDFAPLLGPDHLSIGRFDRATLRNGSVTDDFLVRLSALTGKDLTTAEGAAEANPGVCGAAVAWFLTVNQELQIQSKPASHYATFFRHRKRLVTAFRDSKAMADLPRLKITDPVLEAVIRQKAQDSVAWLNATCLSEAERLPEVPSSGTLPTPAEMRRRLRDWLFSYLTPEAIQVIASELIPVPRDA